MSFKKSLIALSFLSCTLIQCQESRDVSYEYSTPDEIGDGFQVASINDVGLNSSELTKAIERIKKGKHGEVHSILIYKSDKLVLEEYFEGHLFQWDAPDHHGAYVQWDQEMLHPIMSCSKSYTSACIGIAIDKGYIKSVDQSIFDYLPEYQEFNSEGREDITIEHLVTMSSGLAWDEWGAAHGTSANDIDRLYFECSDDPIKCVLERPLLSPPGEIFNYNGGGTVILGEVIRNSSGMNMDEFSRKYLFGPQEVDSIGWFQYDSGAFATDGSIYLSSRDMLKLGVTYLDKGSWNGQQLIVPDWIVKSSVPYGNNHGIRIPIEDSGKCGYGYSWWTSEHKHLGKRIKLFRAGGWGGQEIMVLPDLDMVIVFTGGNYASRSTLYKLVNRYLIPAVDEIE